MLNEIFKNENYDEIVKLFKIDNNYLNELNNDLTTKLLLSKYNINEINEFIVYMLNDITTTCFDNDDGTKSFAIDFDFEIYKNDNNINYQFEFTYQSLYDIFTNDKKQFIQIIMYYLVTLKYYL